MAKPVSLDSQVNIWMDFFQAIDPNYKKDLFGGKEPIQYENIKTDTLAKAGFDYTAFQAIFDTSMVGWGTDSLDSDKANRLLSSVKPTLLSKLFKLGDKIDGNTAAKLIDYYLDDSPNQFHYDQAFLPESQSSPEALLRETGLPSDSVVGIDFDVNVITDPKLDNIKANVLRIETQNNNGEGSAVYLDDGYIITAAHCLTENQAQSPLFHFKLADGTKFDLDSSHIIFKDQDRDIAILYLPTIKRPSSLMTLFLSKKIPVKEDQIYLFGYPVRTEKPTLSVGFVDHIGTYQEYKQYETITTVVGGFFPGHSEYRGNNLNEFNGNEHKLMELIHSNTPEREGATPSFVFPVLHVDQGYSGGPVVNSDGEVIGIVTHGLSNEFAVSPFPLLVESDSPRWNVSHSTPSSFGKREGHLILEYRQNEEDISEVSSVKADNPDLSKEDLIRKVMDEMDVPEWKARILILEIISDEK